GRDGVLDRCPALADARGRRPPEWPVYLRPGTRGAHRLQCRPRLVRAAGVAVGRAAHERGRRVGRADPRLTTPRFACVARAAGSRCRAAQPAQPTVRVGQYTPASTVAPPPPCPGTKCSPRSVG